MMRTTSTSLPDQIILATRNRHKVDELHALLSPLAIRVASVLDYPNMPDVVEDGATFEANAIKKARAITAYTGLPALADDSGLCVDALDGAPGVYSARYAGENGNDVANNAKLLAALADIPDVERGAQFVSVIAYATPAGDIHTFRGTCAGIITRAPRGTNGFGYDPLFYLASHEQTMAELAPSEKNQISHRARAYEQFVTWLTRSIV